MSRIKRRVAGVLAVGLLVGAIGPAVAFAGGYCYPQPPSKCNSGNGNGSDVVTFVVGAHCYGGDPGNSYLAGNRGGDEIPPGIPNPGGNNVAP